MLWWDDGVGTEFIEVPKGSVHCSRNYQVGRCAYSSDEWIYSKG